MTSDGQSPITFNYDFIQNSTWVYIDVLECTPSGDVNGDDNVDILDVVSMVAVVLGNSEPITCADYNNDGSIDVLDIVNVVSLILGS